jgi:hypothetical protein|tara:strand:+ start:2711 stop:3736 length:1026 start_codon:yes stop_codon:yes gene_type:complete
MPTQADDLTGTDFIKRLEVLEKKQKDFIGPDIPDGFFVNGNVEAYYDDRTYDDSWDSRTELTVGIETTLDNDYWIGGSTKWDSHYSLNTALNNTLVEKQIGFGNDTCRVFLGETDAQRLGFAKTPKISAPLIYTQSNFRIDHNEKSVLACGGYKWDNQFKFDTHRLKREMPYAINVGYDRKQDTTYTTATYNLGLVELSYMRISSPKEAPGYSVDKVQEGYAVGGALHHLGIPLVWGVEMWDDKDTGLAEDDRWDIGGLYSLNDNMYVTAHRTINDDLGYSGNYYGLVYNVYTDTNVRKRADQRDGLEFGLYLHDKEQTSVYTGAHTDYGNQIIGSIRWKF